ncbi:MAG TPA: hypothetical protein VGK94_06290 [Candidatus Polarisedimenticolia bacterium]
MAAHLITALAVVATISAGEPLHPGPAADQLTRRTYEVVASKGYAYAATTAGLAVFDLADPNSEKPAATLFFPGSASAISLSGDLAFLSLGPEGLRIIDISRPLAPRLTGALETDGSVNAAAPAGGRHLVLADGAMGLKVADISNPAAPKVIASLDTERYARHLAVSGDLVAVAEEEAGVTFLRLDEAGRLAPLSSIRLEGSSRGVALSGRRCYVAAGPAGLIVLDLSRPDRPGIVAGFPSADYARGVAAAEGMVLLADGNAGLRVLEVKETGGPAPALRTLRAFATTRPANRVSLDGQRGNIALVAEDSAGVRIFDLSGPDPMPGF